MGHAYYDGWYRINEFISDDSRLKNMDKEDIKTKLMIFKVVLDDNTIISN